MDLSRTVLGSVGRRYVELTPSSTEPSVTDGEHTDPTTDGSWSQYHYRPPHPLGSPRAKPPAVFGPLPPTAQCHVLEGLQLSTWLSSADAQPVAMFQALDGDLNSVAVKGDPMPDQVLWLSVPSLQTPPADPSPGHQRTHAEWRVGESGGVDEVEVDSLRGDSPAPQPHDPQPPRATPRATPRDVPRDMPPIPVASAHSAHLDRLAVTPTPDTPTPDSVTPPDSVDSGTTPQPTPQPTALPEITDSEGSDDDSLSSSVDETETEADTDTANGPDTHVSTEAHLPARHTLRVGNVRVVTS